MLGAYIVARRYRIAVVTPDSPIDLFFRSSI